MDLGPQIFCYLLVVNILTMFVFRLDKSAAEAGNRRVPERTLLGLAVIGGSPGAWLASHLFRHKTRKQPFRVTLLIILALQVAIVAYLLAGGANFPPPSGL
jgi:uncharacterized membrane protein YsdA (DUF1294 family)